MLREVWENPIFVRARRVEERRVGGGLKGFLGRYGTGVMLVLGPLSVTMFFSATELVKDPEAWVHQWLGKVLGFTAFLMVLYIAARSVSSTSGMISAEREQRTYESLLATRLTPRDLLLGKLAAGLWPVTRELLAAAPIALVLGLVGGHPLEAAVFVSIAFASNLLFGLLGLWASYGARTTQDASRRGVMLGGALMLLGPMVDYLTHGLFAPDGAGYVPVGTLTSPLAACYSILRIGSGDSGLWMWAWAGTLGMYAVLVGFLWTSLRLVAERARCH
ncbi:MAG: ABC transporter permease subunit [Candidatus Eremiobacterota bacterium]